MGEFTTITTQEEFNAAISERLKREKETILNQFKDYEEIKNKNTENENKIVALQAQLTESQGKHAAYESTIAELNSKNQVYETNSVKMRVALEKGLPYEFASRLSGTTEEEITKDAENLLKYVSVQQPAPIASVESNQNNVDAGLKELLKNVK